MIYVVAPFESENIIKNISSRNIELIKALENKEEATLLLSNFDHRYKKRNDKNEIVNQLDAWNVARQFLPIISYKNNISLMRIVSNISFSISLFLYLAFKLKDGDKVYINSIPPEVILFCSILKRIKDFELLVDVRDIWPDALVNSSRPSITLKLFKGYCNFLYNFSCKKVNKVFYVAPSFLDWINRNFASNVPRQFFPLGYDKNRWSPELEKDPLYEIEIVPEKLNFVYVGYLSQQFDLTNVISSFELLGENAQLHILGGGGNFDFYFSQFNHLNNVTFHGMVHPKVISNNLHRFDAGFLPLRSGAGSLLPNKFFDYIASSTPIISFGSPDVVKLVNDLKLGWNVDNSKESIVELIGNLTKQDLTSCREQFEKIQSNYCMQILCMNVAAKL